MNARAEQAHSAQQALATCAHRIRSSVTSCIWRDPEPEQLALIFERGRRDCAGGAGHKDP